MNLEEGSLSSHGAPLAEVREDLTENVLLEKNLKEKSRCLSGKRED